VLLAAIAALAALQAAVFVCPRLMLQLSARRTAQALHSNLLDVYRIANYDDSQAKHKYTMCYIVAPISCGIQS
jgi:hypothetical protein